MKFIDGVAYCDAPDRDEPRMKCGYPIPCPYHTRIIVIRTTRPLGHSTEPLPCSSWPIDPMAPKVEQ